MPSVGDRKRNPETVDGGPGSGVSDREGVSKHGHLETRPSTQDCLGSGPNFSNHFVAVWPVSK
jgi:hypothetical protein